MLLVMEILDSSIIKIVQSEVHYKSDLLLKIVKKGGSINRFYPPVAIEL